MNIVAGIFASVLYGKMLMGISEYCSTVATMNVLRFSHHGHQILPKEYLDVSTPVVFVRQGTETSTEELSKAWVFVGSAWM